MKLERQSADDIEKVLRRWKNPQVPELRRWKNPQVPELQRWKNPQKRGADKSNSKKTKKTMYQYSEKFLSYGWKVFRKSVFLEKLKGRGSHGIREKLLTKRLEHFVRPL